jgi:hypothetical protein
MGLGVSVKNGVDKAVVEFLSDLRKALRPTRRSR